jgi:UDP-N-acetylglucosamine--N-acetylmuramyl-(pentapeptide) pyrophosphoryl-undecaprenol N-acetylglucosamine transferase
MRGKSLIIAGGGTGGHVLAGVAVADAWKKKFGTDAEVLFVGARGGIEEKLVPRAGYPLELLELGSLNRVSFGRKIKTLFQLPLSLIRSAGILSKFKPDAVLGVGGYASGPLVLMARVLGARTAILEQNSVPGMTNRILGKIVDRVFSAFPGADAHFSPTKVRVTGNPVRSVIEALADLPPSVSRTTPFTLFIFGGSQGAMGINTLVLDALPFLKARMGGLRVIHQTGERDFERVKSEYTKAGCQARVEKFIYEMPEMYANSSLVICRSGSGTLSEIAAAGRASVLVPFPQASDNHQEFNARIFSDAGAAVLMLQGVARGEDLARTILDFLDHPEKQRVMESRVREFHQPKAAERIALGLASV